ncbi:MAG: hypothetical protein RLZZ440_2340 [Planctomycetota bacterium]
MTFLQPWVLAALPLVSLPLIIHLINQRRFQTVQWGGMMFLLAAKALSSGYSRLRHWLIMLLRMLAVAGVILAVGRPLSRGWLALAGGGRPDTAIMILDTSPSMQARDPAVVDTKLATGRRQLAESLATLAAAHCLVLPAEGEPIEIPPEAIADLAAAAPAAAPADIPGRLQAAYEYIRENAAGTAEIWICSDERTNDWALDTGGWAGLRDAFAKLPQQVRFQLVAFPAPAVGNLAVRVTDPRVRRRGEARELVVRVLVTRTDGPGSPEPTTIPLRFEIGGVVTVVDLTVSGREAVLADHVLPLGRAAEARGWGRVSIPADANEADNEFFFVFDEPPPRVTLVVAEEDAVGQMLELAASIPPTKDLTARVDRVPPAALATAAWDEAAALLWQGQLPTGREAEVVAAFLARGGQAIFFPPEQPSEASFAGLSWRTWSNHAPPLEPEQWRSDQDVLANTVSGGALPLGELVIRRTCGLGGEFVPLASLAGGVPLVVRPPAAAGISCCTTLPTPRDSTLASEGIVFYALVQRVIDRGLEPLAGARQLDAGPAAAALARGSAAAWSRLAGAGPELSTPAGLGAGVFSAAGRLVAVNRPSVEDTAAIVSDERIDELFRGLAYSRVSSQAGGGESVVQEIWRAFLIAMLGALVLEGLLSLPRRSEPAGGRPRPVPPAERPLAEAVA